MILRSVYTVYAKCKKRTIQLLWQQRQNKARPDTHSDILESIKLPVKLCVSFIDNKSLPLSFN